MVAATLASSPLGRLNHTSGTESRSSNLNLPEVFISLADGDHIEALRTRRQLFAFGIVV